MHEGGLPQGSPSDCRLRISGWVVGSQLLGCRRAALRTAACALHIREIDWLILGRIVNILGFMRSSASHGSQTASALCRQLIG